MISDDFSSHRYNQTENHVNEPSQPSDVQAQPYPNFVTRRRGGGGGGTLNPYFALFRKVFNLRR